MRTKESKPTLSNPKGFTIVEILVSMALIAITFLGVLATYTTSMTVQHQVDDRGKALFLAQKAMEELATLPYEDLNAGIYVDYFEDELSQPLSLIKQITNVADPQIHALWTRITDPDSTTAYKLVTVTAEWGSPYTPNEDLERITLNWIRVRNENTVEFREKASSQLP